MRKIEQSIKNFAAFIVFLGAVTLFAAFSAQGQTTSVLTTGLNTPVKMIAAGDNSLLVTEQGILAPNTGRVSRVDRTTGARQTLIADLPSGVTNLGNAGPEPNGPTGLLLHGRTLFVAISSGDAVSIVGGRELPNPVPSSPLYASVLEFKLPGNWEHAESPFVMTMDHQTALAAGDTVTIANAEGLSLRARVVANLPEYTPNPSPAFPDAVRSSNLFGIAMFQKHLYLNDASQNNIVRVSIEDGTSSIFATFPNKPNPLPFGPPFIEPVPDSIRRVGNRLLVTLLTGFPFVPGLAEVRSVSLKSGEHETLIPGLTSAIDVLPLDSGGYYTLEFSTNMFPPPAAPGRVRFYAAATAEPVPVVVGLISPTSLARDENTGDLFMTNIFTGTITKIDLP